jgi:hypothetical protein
MALVSNKAAAEICSVDENSDWLKRLKSLGFGMETA